MKKIYLFLITVFILNVAKAQNPFGNITYSIIYLPCSSGSDGMVHLTIDSAGSYLTTNLNPVFSNPNLSSDAYITYGLNTIVIEKSWTNLKDTIQFMIAEYQSLSANNYNNDTSFCQHDYDPFSLVLSSNSILNYSNISVSNPSYFNSSVSAFKTDDTIFFNANQICDTGRNELVILAYGIDGCLITDTVAVYKHAAPQVFITFDYSVGLSPFGASDGVQFCGNGFIQYSVLGADSVWALYPLDTMIYIADYANTSGIYGGPYLNNYGGINLATGCISGGGGLNPTYNSFVMALNTESPIRFPISNTTIYNTPDSLYANNITMKDSYSCDIDAGVNHSDCGIVATVLDIADAVSLQKMNCTVIENYKPFIKNGILHLSRYFELTPDVQAPAQVTLYFSHAHFTQYNDSATAQGSTLFSADTTIGYFGINIVKVSGGLYGTGGTITNIPAAAVWNTVRQCWAVTFNVVSFSAFYITQALSPLSIGTVLQGYTMPNGNQLQWQNSAGNAVQSTNIECSLDGNTWQKCAINLDANGSYFHATLSNKMLYRVLSYISTTDHYYSNSIVLEKKSPNAIIISPNPIVDNLFVNIAIAKNSAVQIRIVDAMGKEVATKSTTAEIGMHKIQIPLANISTGLYTAMIFVNDELVYREKISKQ